MKNQSIKKDGSRIEGLKLMKNQKKILRELYKGEIKSMNDMKKFIEDSLNNEIKLNDPKSGCSIF